VAGTGKTYVLLQASRKVKEIATFAARKDPIFRVAPTRIVAYNFYSRTLYSLFKIPIKIPAGGLS
jgi:hypothetical protein